jgi:glycine/D-amino acid oxidase-like deaminating enzyme
MTAQRPGQDFPQSNGLRTWSFVQKRGFDYVVQRPGKPDKNGELMVGGGVFQSSRGIEEFGSTDDGTMDPVIAAYLGGILPAVFGSENWGADSPQGRLKEMWTGTMGYTADMQPIVGRLDYSLTGRVVRPRSSASSFPQPEPSEWISAGYNGEGMVHAWLCGVAAGLMILGRENVNRKGVIGSPEGMMKDWLPEEFLCSTERITSADVSVLLSLM